MCISTPLAGACCLGLTDTFCTESTESDCNAQLESEYQGDGTTCDTNPCGITTPTPTPNPEVGPLVIVPTMTEWGMIFLTIILGVLAVIGLRRKGSQDT